MDLNFIIMVFLSLAYNLIIVINDNLYYLKY